MSRPSVGWLAWSLAGLSVGMFVASVVLFVLARSAHVPSSWGVDFTVGGLWGVPFLAFPVVGALIASKRPGNPIGWILLADGLVWMFLFMNEYYGVYGVAKPGSVPFPVGMAGMNNWLWVPAVGLLGTYLLLLFPDGKLPSRRLRPLAWLSGAVIVVLSAAVALDPGPLQNLGGVRNPFGLEKATWVGAAYIVIPLLPLCALASAMSLVLRYQRSTGEVREQIKWMAFAASFVGLVPLFAVASSLFFPSKETWFAEGSPLWLELLQYAALLSFAGLPVAVGFAVLKHRLYDIDIVINRALVYGSLTVTLAAVYIGSVVGLQATLRVLSGQESTLAVVASTLAIAALFNPLRRRIQGFVDRRFYRKKYDAAKTLEAFSATLRDETDLDRLGGALAGAVGETMQPSHVSLWLRPETDAKGEQAD